jgi:hypothetical protein
MATTYTLISSTTLTGTQATVTFSSIPSTYTDLVIRLSSRSDGGQASYRVTLNSDSGTNYSDTFIYGDGSAPASGRDSNRTYGWAYGAQNPGTFTTNTFSNSEIYIPNYTVSSNKVFLSDARNENNDSTAYIWQTANLWRNTATISSIVLTPNSGNILAESSFYLYGIKNS